jgi:hypothetical protein
MNGLDDSDENEYKVFPDTGCMDDGAMSDEEPVRKKFQSEMGGGKVPQVHIDSDDDLSSGAYESWDDEPPKKVIAQIKSNGLRKLQAPGMGSIKFSKSKSTIQLNGFSKPVENKDLNNDFNNKETVSSTKGHDWVNLGTNNPWSNQEFNDNNDNNINMKTTPDQVINPKPKNEEEDFKHIEGDAIDRTGESIDNPMLWDEPKDKLWEEEDVNAILSNWDHRDDIKSPQNSEENIIDDFEPDFKTPVRHRVQDSPLRRSTYVTRSVDMKLRKSRLDNPIESFNNNEEFRYYLRSDSQVLFSLLDIDSKNLEFPNHDQPITENLASDYDYDYGNEIEIDSKPKLEWFKECSKFIRHKLKNHKEKRKHRQILRIDNKENNDNNSKNPRNTFDFREYTGVAFKNYLRGNKMDLKIVPIYHNQIFKK